MATEQCVLYQQVGDLTAQVFRQGACRKWDESSTVARSTCHCTDRKVISEKTDTCT